MPAPPEPKRGDFEKKAAAEKTAEEQKPAAETAADAKAPSKEAEPDKWQLLVDLCARQDRAADEAVEQIKATMKEFGERPDQIAIRVARTQEDADRLGWPCVGAHVAVVRRVMERAPTRIVIAPVYPGESDAADAAAARRTAH